MSARPDSRPASPSRRRAVSVVVLVVVGLGLLAAGARVLFPAPEPPRLVWFLDDLAGPLGHPRVSPQGAPAGRLRLRHTTNEFIELQSARSSLGRFLDRMFGRRPAAPERVRYEVAGEWERCGDEVWIAFKRVDSRR